MEETTNKEVRICSNCGEIAVRKCANCKAVFYCKKECQKQDWNNGHKEECRPVKVCFDSLLGRYLIATKDFKAGDLIFTEKPLVIGPKQLTNPICLSCYSKVNGSYRCSVCSWPLCSQKCEVGPNHLPECTVGREIGSPIEIKDFEDTNHFYEVVLPLRCLALKKTSPKKYNTLIDLESHAKERRGTELAQENKKKIVNMLRNYFMLVYFPSDQIDSSESSIERIIGILDTNAVDISLQESVISGLFATFSMIEHSCIPNVKYHFNSQHHVIVKAATDLKAGDHLAISYSNVLWGTLARREHLKISKFFLCTCKRCADPTELGSNFSSIRCVDCGKGFLTSAAPLDERANWICSECNIVVPLETIKEITLKLGDEVEKLISSPSLYEIEKFIKDKSDNLIHPNHFHLFNLKHTLLQLYGRDDNLNEENISKKEILCQNVLKICSALDPGLTKIPGYVATVLYEYHLAIMTRNRDPSEGPINPITVRKDIEAAKSLLRKCVNVLMDEPSYSPEGRLKQIALNSYRELEELMLNR